MSYEGYEPAGIIKANWVHKHKHSVPAVVVVLMEWDDTKQWDLQEATLASAITRYKYDPSPLPLSLSPLHHITLNNNNTTLCVVICAV